MSEQPFDELRQVFREALVDLPPALEARLNAIPELQRHTANGYLVRLLPLLTLIPGFLWAIIRYGADLIEYLAGLMQGLSSRELPSLSFLTSLFQNLTLSELSLPALPAIDTFTLLVVAAVVGLTMIAAVGWYLWHESQLDAQHMSLLNQSR